MSLSVAQEGFRQSLSALSAQREDLKALRAQAAASAAVSLVVFTTMTGVLNAPQILERQALLFWPTVFATFAVTCMLLSLCFAALGAVAWETMRFFVNGEKFSYYARYESNREEVEFWAELISDLERFFSLNESAIEKCQDRIQLSFFFVAAQALLWALMIIGVIAHVR